MKNFIKKNWFQIVVIILLCMCYAKLQEISVASYYTANIVSDSVTASGEDTAKILKDIESNTENTWYSVQGLR